MKNVTMEVQTFLEIVPDMSDLELAVLLSLVADQHCLITTEDNLMEDLANELSLIVSEMFNLSYTVLSLDQLQSVEEFGASILNDDPTTGFAATERLDNGSFTRSLRTARSSMRTGSQANTLNLDSRTVVNVIIARNFNLAHRDVQIATLELIVKRRIFSHTTVHPVPKTFLFIPLVAASAKESKLTYHLNDRIAISHHHALQDGFANLEEFEQPSNVDQISISSSDRRSVSSTRSRSYRITPELIGQIRKRGQSVRMTVEIRRYIQDLIVFLRMERGVNGGISPVATSVCVELSKCLAALHGIDYVTPSLVALAVRKVYPHRIVLATPERERSMQWGSNYDAVKETLQGLTAEVIIDNVLSGVQCPI